MISDDTVRVAMKKSTMIAKITAVVSGVHLLRHIKEICALSSNNPRTDFTVVFDRSGRYMVFLACIV